MQEASPRLYLWPAHQEAVINERADILIRFGSELDKASGDGQTKRQAGVKPPWYIDPEHKDAFYRHLRRWECGEELVDPDSGAHTLVHAAWRLLAIACQETGNVPDVPDLAGGYR